MSKHRLFLVALIIALGALPADARDAADASDSAGAPEAAVPDGSPGTAATSNSPDDNASAGSPPGAAALSVASLAQASSEKKPTKSMAATVLLWLVVPGGGNFYNGAIGKGLIELGGSVGGLVLMANAMSEECEVFRGLTFCEEVTSGSKLWGGFGTMMGFRVWGLVTAIKRTNEINSGKTSPYERFRIAIPTKKSGFKVEYNHTF